MTRRARELLAPRPSHDRADRRRPHHHRPRRPQLALAVLGEQFGPATEPGFRSLPDGRTTCGAALLWLIEHECVPAEALLDPDPAVFSDVLALTLVGR